jgi:hypothetical protein
VIEYVASFNAQMVLIRRIQILKVATMLVEEPKWDQDQKQSNTSRMHLDVTRSHLVTAQGSVLSS